MASTLAGIDSSSMHNVHLDVLGATPETEESKGALVEELKRRARGSIGSKNYAEAEVLYSKAIEVVTTLTTTTTTAAAATKESELAILYTNRSLCRYHMGKFDASIHDARQATLLDSSYVKAHWRLGQALNQQKNYAQALSSFQQALQLDPNNKALQKELRTTEQQLQKYNNTNNNNNNSKPTTTTTTTTTTSTSSSTTTKPKRSNTKTHIKDNDDDDDEDDAVQFTPSEAMRGYKIVDGKKTSYFHREISEEERRLIGDIAPKKLEEDTTTTTTTTTAASSNFITTNTTPVVEGTSVWNKAGTWEEKDVTQWATDTLRAALLSTQYTLPPSVTANTPLCASVTKVKNLSGHASVATVRGKRRYIYEFAITIEWKLPLDTTGDDNNKICRGTLTFPDVDGTCDGEYDISDYTVNSDSPPEARHLLDRYIKSEGLRNEITKTFNNWIQLFEATYSI